jgi:hypothetical protein
MTRYKGRQSAKAIERDFPHIVEMVVPEGGLGKRLDAMYDFHGTTFMPGTVACKPYSYLRKKIDGVSPHFTLDACRHGGMTELEEAALTEGQGRALSGHKTAQAYRGYAKETFDRALAATRKRHAHRLANAQGTSVQNDGGIGVQNENLEVKATGAK